MVTLGNVLSLSKKMVLSSFNGEYRNSIANLIDINNYKKVRKDLSGSLIVRGEAVDEIMAAVGTMTVANAISAILLGTITSFAVIGVGDTLTRICASIGVLLLVAVVLSILEEYPVVQNRIILVIMIVLGFEIIVSIVSILKLVIALVAMFSPISCIHLFVRLISLQCYSWILGAIMGCPVYKRPQRRRRPQHIERGNTRV